MRWLKFLLIAFLLNISFAYSDIPVRLEKFQPLAGKYQGNLIKGGEFFSAHCMSCHSLKLFDHDAIGRLSGVTIDKMPNFSAKSWDGNPPPDLSLVAKYKGVDWLYTYLLSFYQDQSGKNNNLLVKNTAMPNPYMVLQGKHNLVVNNKALLKLAAIADKPPWYRVLKQIDAGKITAKEFNREILSLVMFLDYVAEPQKQQRLDLAPWVLSFLAVLFVLAWLLKKSYWQEIE